LNTTKHTNNPLGTFKKHYKYFQNTDWPSLKHPLSRNITILPRMFIQHSQDIQEILWTNIGNTYGTLDGHSSKLRKPCGKYL